MVGGHCQQLGQLTTFSIATAIITITELAIPIASTSTAAATAVVIAAAAFAVSVCEFAITIVGWHGWRTVAVATVVFVIDAGELHSAGTHREGMN